MKWFFVAVFLVLTLIFLLEYRIVGQAVYGDGKYYWAFTRSLYFSHDIDISDEMAHHYTHENNNKEMYFGTVKEYEGKTKFATAGFSLGMSFVWLPLYFIADALVVLLSSVGVEVVRNGYSDIYQIVVGIGNILFVIGGLILLSQVLKRWYSKRVVLLTLTLVVFATNLLYYGGLDTINSHPLSFLLVNILLWLLFRYKDSFDSRLIVWMGIVAGYLIANRRQDVFFSMIPLLLIGIEFVKPLLQKKKNSSFALFLKRLSLLCLGLFLGYLPQLLLVSAGQGQLALYARTTRAFSFPTHFLELLFDPKLGLALYMPVFLIGVFGLFLLCYRRKEIGYLFLAVVILEYVLISSWYGWSQAAYTMRYFISCIPLIAFGIAEVIVWLEKRFSFTFLCTCVALLVMHECLMIVGFKLFNQDPTFVGSELSRSGQLKQQIIEYIRNLLQR